MREHSEAKANEWREALLALPLRTEQAALLMRQWLENRRDGGVDTIVYVNVTLPREDDWSQPDTSIDTLGAESLVFIDIAAGVPASMPDQRCRITARTCR